MFNSDLDIDIPKFLIVNTRDPGLRTAFYEKEHGIMWNAWNGSGAGGAARSSHTCGHKLTKSWDLTIYFHSALGFSNRMWKIKSHTHSIKFL